MNSFLAPVNYEIGIDYSRDFEIEFDVNSVQQLLKHIDPNKAPGPDQIHGKVLQYGSKSLAKPLAILFRLSYNSCKIGNVPILYQSIRMITKTILETIVQYS
jgi:hypothetical protein